MDVIRRDHEVQDDQAVADPRLVRPVEPDELVTAKLEQEFFLVAPVSNVPDPPREEIPIGSRHRVSGRPVSDKVDAWRDRIFSQGQEARRVFLTQKTMVLSLF